MLSSHHRVMVPSIREPRRSERALKANANALHAGAAVNSVMTVLTMYNSFVPTKDRSMFCTAPTSGPKMDTAEPVNPNAHAIQIPRSVGIPTTKVTKKPNISKICTVNQIAFSTTRSEELSMRRCRVAASIAAAEASIAVAREDMNAPSCMVEKVGLFLSLLSTARSFSRCFETRIFDVSSRFHSRTRMRRGKIFWETGKGARTACLAFSAVENGGQNVLSARNEQFFELWNGT